LIYILLEWLGIVLRLARKEKVTTLSIPCSHFFVLAMAACTSYNINPGGYVFGGKTFTVKVSWAMILIVGKTFTTTTHPSLQLACVSFYKNVEKGLRK
jgi:hypothetical protein